MSIRFIRVIFMCLIGLFLAFDVRGEDAMKAWLDYGEIKNESEYNTYCNNQIRKIYYQIDLKCIEYENLSPEEKARVAKERADQYERMNKDANNDKIYFHYSCKEGHKGTCDEFFADANVTLNDAERLIKLYLGTEHVSCYGLIRRTYVSGVPKDDYLACTRYDRKGYEYYEFKFDDLRESNDSTRYGSIMKTLRKIATNQIDKDKTSDCGKGKLREKCICNRTGDMAGKFSMYSGWGKNDFYGVEQCLSGFLKDGPKNSKHYSFEYREELADGNSIFGISAEARYNIQINAATDLEVMYCRHIQNMIRKNGKGTLMKSCAYEGDKTIRSNSVDNDNMLYFRVKDTNDIEYWVRFVLDDITELSYVQASAGMAKLKCLFEYNGIINHDNGSCEGIQEPQCTRMDKYLRERGGGGARWDKDLELCVVDDIADAELVEDIYAWGMDIAGWIGSVGGAMILVVATAGNTVLLTIGIVTFVAGVAIVKYQEYEISKRAYQFIEQMRTCVECEEALEDGFCLKYKKKSCAINLIGRFFSDVYEEYDSFDSDLKTTFDAYIDVLSESLPPDYKGWEEAGLDAKNIEEAMSKIKVKASETNSKSETAIIFGDVLQVVGGIFMAAGAVNADVSSFKGMISKVNKYMTKYKTFLGNIQRTDRLISSFFSGDALGIAFEPFRGTSLFKYKNFNISANSGKKIWKDGLGLYEDPSKIPDVAFEFTETVAEATNPLAITVKDMNKKIQAQISEDVIKGGLKSLGAVGGRI